MDNINPQINPTINHKISPQLNPQIKPEVFIVDVDGVLTTGNFFYSAEGKVMKMFGPDDHDALLLLKPYMKIHFISGDKKGFAISEKRVIVDMKMTLDLVSTIDRLPWIKERFDLKKVIYMGDGIFDARVFKAVGYSIATNDAFYKTKELANFVTNSRGGNRAVAEACFHILETFFPEHKDLELTKGDGEWGREKL